MINGKIAFWSGLGGFLLSFLIGIIGGVLFGALILRALLWGLLFALLGAALHYVISRFLPEMLSKPAARQEGGGSIDIVLPEEMPRSVSAGSSLNDEELPVEELEESEVEEIPTAEAVEESGEPIGEPQKDDSFFSAIRDEEAELAEELPEFEGEGIAEDRGKSGSSVQPPKRASVLSPKDSVDPAEIARAIRTALKKDQKG